jgi:hypothetical protein
MNDMKIVEKLEDTVNRPFTPEFCSTSVYHCLNWNYGIVYLNFAGRFQFNTFVDFITDGVA